MERPARVPLHSLFFASGACGLIYQVIWVRQFGNIFGNTVHSAALVTGVFMLGLGFGGWLIGRWLDKVDADGPRSLALYGKFEVAIGLIGLGIALLLPLLAPLSAATSSYSVGPEGWYEPGGAGHYLRYVLAAAMLLPITALMGGTLPLLIRYRLRSGLDGVGLKVAWLYGINTVGAAVGALSVDFFLVPAAGLFATQTLAVAINLGVGLIALRYATASGGIAAAETPSGDPPRSVAGQRATTVAVGLAIALSGFGAMGVEMVWFRLLRSALGGYRATFSILLAVVLVGMWLGSLLGGWLERRFGRAGLLYGAAQALFVLTTLVCVSLIGRIDVWDVGLVEAYRGGGPFLRRLVDLWSLIRVAIWVAALPAVMMGFAFPLANALVQRTQGHVGGRAGALYLANTLGAVAGSTLAGFLLIPALGMQRSLLLLAAASALAILPLLYVAARQAPRAEVLKRWALPLLIGLAPLLWWGSLPAKRLAEMMYPGRFAEETLLVQREGINETIAVTEFADGSRSLYTNGHPMSATRYSALRYMRAFSHVPLLEMAAPKHVLVICFGVGNTTHAASLHPTVTALHVADLSENVLSAAPYFERWNKGVLKDPRVSVFVNDGRQHLRTQDEGFYDLVTLEPPPIRQAGMASLYSVEFYQLAHSRLREGGYMTQWLPASQALESANRAIVKAFIDVFPGAIMLSGYDDEFILVGVKGGKPHLDPAAWKARLAERPTVAEDMKAIDLLPLSEYVATFVADYPTLQAATKGVEPITDDLPLMEYGPARFGQFIIPPNWFGLDGWAAWCPECATQPGLKAQVDGLMANLKAHFSSPNVLTQGAVDPVPLRAPLPKGEAAVAARKGSRLLQRLMKHHVK